MTPTIPSSWVTRILSGRPFCRQQELHPFASLVSVTGREQRGWYLREFTLRTWANCLLKDNDNAVEINRFLQIRVALDVSLCPGATGEGRRLQWSWHPNCFAL